MQRRAFNQSLFFAGVSLVCASSKVHAGAVVQRRRRWEMDGLDFNNNFSGARLNDLIRLSEGRYVAVIRPEYTPINPSPWYCFEVQSEQPRQIALTFRIDSLDENFKPVRCPRPWVSSDGKNFVRVADADWTVVDHEGTARIILPAGRSQISAWKPVTLEACNQWAERVQELPFVGSSIIGLSTEGRPLRQLTIGETKAQNYVVVLGGQHPPEITSYLGLMAFVDEISGKSELAASFRQNFQTVVIPMINPDGKFHGHWRGTLAGVDPNRDWRTQNLPEIQATAGHLLKTVVGEGKKTCCAVDFHATNEDFFYVDEKGGKAGHAEFSQRWFGRIEQELGGTKVVTKPGPEMGSSRTWMTDHLNTPSYTREFRYNQPEDEVRSKAKAEARALMKLLLEG